MTRLARTEFVKPARESEVQLYNNYCNAQIDAGSAPVMRTSIRVASCERVEARTTAPRSPARATAKITDCAAKTRPPSPGPDRYSALKYWRRGRRKWDLRETDTNRVNTESRNARQRSLTTWHPHIVKIAEMRNKAECSMKLNRFPE